MCIQSWELIQGRLLMLRNPQPFFNCPNKHQCSPHSGCSCTVHGLWPLARVPGPGNGNCLLSAVGQTFLKIMNKINLYVDKNKMPTLGHGEGGGGFSHSSSLLDRAAEMLDTLLSSQMFIFLCAWVTLPHLKWVFKSVLLNCCKILCGCSSVDLILVYVDLVSCQLLLNPFETELNQLTSVLAI